MRFKEFMDQDICILEMTDYAATHSAEGGDKVIIADLKSIGVNKMNVKELSHNIDLKTNIKYAHIKISDVNWKQIIAKLMTKGYKVESKSGVSYLEAIIKKGNYYFNFSGDTKPISQPPFVEISALISTRKNSEEEIKDLLYKTRA